MACDKNEHTTKLPKISESGFDSEGKARSYARKHVGRAVHDDRKAAGKECGTCEKGLECKPAIKSSFIDDHVFSYDDDTFGVDIPKDTPVKTECKCVKPKKKPQPKKKTSGKKASFAPRERRR